MKEIRLKCCNGITFESALKEILNEVSDQFSFVNDEENPEFILFGPYGNDIPVKSDRYQRIGYYCENIRPELNNCEWAFGIPHATPQNQAKYHRIQWHGLDPQLLVKNLSDNDIDRIMGSKIKFCNFLYSHPVHYRETFFKQLSKYKKVDAPGKSMNNMPSIDELYTGTIWERKRQFLSDYKFTIAFENYSYPGYQTEKLYDAMQENSLPIYCGDPEIGQIFNTKSFLNAFEYVKINRSPAIRQLEESSQMDFIDILPQYYKTPFHRTKRKVKSMARELKMNLQFNKLDFSALIDRVIEIDKNPDLYAQYLREPWFNHNEVPEALSTKQRWTKIFSS